MFSLVFFLSLFVFRWNQFNKWHTYFDRIVIGIESIAGNVARGERRRYGHAQTEYDFDARGMAEAYLADVIER